jgi:hypothetical protein
VFIGERDLPRASELLIWGSSRLTDSGVISLRARYLENVGCDGF